MQHSKSLQVCFEFLPMLLHLMISQKPSCLDFMTYWTVYVQLNIWSCNLDAIICFFRVQTQWTRIRY
jgi:hypothetical protein